MQGRYFYEALAALNRWSKAEKEDPAEHWQEKMDSYKCKPHTHDENPLAKLYNMEGNQ
jgi:hypothetical protein